MTSSREKFFYTRTLCCLLKSLEGVETEIELRNDSSVKGIIETVSSAMSVTMRNCVLTFGDRRKFFQNLFIQGRKIRMVFVPDDINMIQAMQQTISRFNVQFQGRKEFLKPRRQGRSRGSSRGRGGVFCGKLSGTHHTFVAGNADVNAQIYGLKDIHALTGASDMHKGCVSASQLHTNDGAAEQRGKDSEAIKSKSDSNIQDILKQMAYNTTEPEQEQTLHSGVREVYLKQLASASGEQPHHAETIGAAVHQPYMSPQSRKADQSFSLKLQDTRDSQFGRHSSHKSSVPLSSQECSTERHKHSSRHYYSPEVDIKQSRIDRRETTGHHKAISSREDMYPPQQKSRPKYDVQTNRSGDGEKLTSRYDQSGSQESRSQGDHSRKHFSNDRLKDKTRRDDSEERQQHTKGRTSVRVRAPTRHDHYSRSYSKDEH